MLRLSDGRLARAVKRAATVFLLPVVAGCLTGYAARAEQPVMASPQRLGGQSAQAGPGLAASPAPRASLNADLNGSADYYRGYRDALRDAARLSRPYGSYRGRANTNTAGYRTWPPSGTLASSTMDTRQREAVPTARGDAPATQDRQAVTEQHEQARPRYTERRPERLPGRASDPLHASPDRRIEERRPASEPPGTADSRMPHPLPHPLPMPQSSLPQSYMLQPTPLQSQAAPSQTLASGFDPAARPR